MSAPFGGHGITATPRSSRRSRTRFDWWTGQRSCWKKKASVRERSLKNVRNELVLNDVAIRFGVKPLDSYKWTKSFRWQCPPDVNGLSPTPAHTLQVRGIIPETSKSQIIRSGLLKIVVLLKSNIPCTSRSPNLFSLVPVSWERGLVAENNGFPVLNRPWCLFHGKPQADIFLSRS